MWKLTPGNMKRKTNKQATKTIQIPDVFVS